MTDPLRARVARLGTVLTVWAHPDDESYLAGGLMAAAVDDGQRVVCVTAIAGEAARSEAGDGGSPSSELGDIRVAELASALAKLGVREHILLGYPDAGCAAVDPEAASQRLAEIFSSVRPDTVVTFGQTE